MISGSLGRLIHCPTGSTRFAAYPKSNEDHTYFYDCSTTSYALLKKCKPYQIFDITKQDCKFTPAISKKLRSVRNKRQDTGDGEGNSLVDDMELEPALGREIQLGSLYYGMEDRIDKSANLWKTETIKKNATIIKKPSSRTNFAITQTIKERVNLFSVNLRAKLLLITIDSSVGREKRTVAKSASVTFVYDAISSAESISQDLRSKLDFPDICLDIHGRDNPPTHVVSTVIRYEHIL